MKNKLKKTAKVWIALLIVALLAVAGIITYLLLHAQKPVEMEQTVVALTPNPVPPAPSSIAIPGYPELTLSSGSGVIPVVFENPEGNHCYFKLDLVLTDTQQSVWSSQNFKPGTGIQNPVATYIPAPGVYNAELRYTTTSLDDLRPLNGAVTKVKLTVE